MTNALLERRVKQGPPTAAEAREEADLVAACLAGVVTAQERFVERYGGLVYRVVRGHVWDESAAEDIVQETFLRVFKNLGRFRGGARLSTWIYRIALNEARMHIRSTRAEKRIPAEALVPIEPDGHMRHIPDWSRHPERTLLERELRDALGRSIAALPENFRSVYLLCEIEGLDNAQAARSLRITAQTVKTRLHRARLRLRLDLSHYMEERV